MSDFDRVYKTHTKEFTFNFSAVQPTSVGITVDESASQDIEIPPDTKDIVVQLDSTPTASVSSNMDLNVLAAMGRDSNGALVFTTVPWNSEIAALGDAAIKAVPVTTGPIFLRLQLDNNDATNSATTIAKVTLRG